MTPPSPRSFDVESPLRAKLLLLAVVIPLGLVLTRLGSEIGDPTIAAILPFSAMLAGAVAFLWPRKLIVGADGVALEGFFNRYERWDGVTSVRVERTQRGRGSIVLGRKGRKGWKIEPQWEVDVPVLAAEMEARRRAFDAAEGERAGSAVGETEDYRAAPLAPHVRVLVDPRNPLEQRVAAARTIASLDRARADDVLGEVLAETADPRARRAFVRT